MYVCVRVFVCASVFVCVCVCNYNTITVLTPLLPPFTHCTGTLSELHLSPHLYKHSNHEHTYTAIVNAMHSLTCDTGILTSLTYSIVSQCTCAISALEHSLRLYIHCTLRFTYNRIV